MVASKKLLGHLVLSIKRSDSAVLAFSLCPFCQQLPPRLSSPNHMCGHILQTSIHNAQPIPSARSPLLVQYGQHAAYKIRNPLGKRLPAPRQLFLVLTPTNYTKCTEANHNSGHQPIQLKTMENGCLVVCDQEVREFLPLPLWTRGEGPTAPPMGRGELPPVKCVEEALAWEGQR